ncbi:unnamed protein product [Cylicocyclus nassatus]|uniref:V-type proton ATPase proteolipid subunit n=1 Tax=Cylicocyclus nassatus TaxID=53992 RepID=A0AA36GU51_CYLNA|nr:unnamed protein product [Cylicocyclus nassatus]
MSTTANPELIEAEKAMYGPFFGTMGVTAAMMFTAAGSAYGTAKSGTGIASMAVARPDLVMKAIIPVVMAGIVAIYGLVVAVIISGKVSPAGDEYKVQQGFAQFGGGLVCGLCGLGAGYAIGIAGDVGVRALSQQPRMFVGCRTIYRLLNRPRMLLSSGTWEQPRLRSSPYWEPPMVQPNQLLAFAPWE